MASTIPPTNQPKVSLLVAAYNIENYIAECLHSLVNQTLKEIEIIVVNDGSTDNTLAIIQTFAQKDTRIQIIDQPNQGLSNVRKIGFQAASGKYIQFVDGDDWLALNACEQLYQKAESAKSDVVIFHYQETYSSKKNKNCLGYTKKQDMQLHPFIRFVRNDLFCSVCIKFIRKQFITDCTILFLKDITYGEDNAFSGSLFLHNPTIGYLDAFLYFYRRVSTGASNNLHGYINDSDKHFSHIRKTLKVTKANQLLIDYADFYFLITLNNFHLSALKNGDKKIAKKLSFLILEKNIIISKKIQHKSLLRYIIYNIYRYQPKIIILVNHLRSFMRI